MSIDPGTLAESTGDLRVPGSVDSGRSSGGASGDLRRDVDRCLAVQAVGLAAAALAAGCSVPPALSALDERRARDRMHAFEVLERVPDPSVVTDVAARERIVATGEPWKIRHVASGIVMLLVPPGEFVMGGADGELAHPRVIRRAFYLSQNEVSKAEWSAIVGKDRVPGAFAGDSLPVESVSWNMVNDEFIASSLGFFRLPSEAEWEYACRAGTTTRYSFGDTITKEQARFDAFDARGGPVACGRYPANPWGFHDMHGNVFEWVEDVYARYPKEGGTEEAVTSGGPGRVLRGGSWNCGFDILHASYRIHRSAAPEDIGDISSGFGFRVARSPL